MSFHDKFISERSKARSHSHFTLNQTAKTIKPHSNPIFISGGLPNPIGFPIDEITVSLSTSPNPRPRFVPAATLFSKPGVVEFPEITENSTRLSQNLKILKFAQSLETAQNGNGGQLTLERSLQYGEQDGHPQLKKFVKALTKRLHPPKLEEKDWNVIITNGGGDGIHKAVDLLINPGDHVLVEEYCFSPSFDNIKSVGGILVPIKLDYEEGLDVSDLKRILENWDEDKQGRKPRVLYSVPSGQNPYGVSQSLERRKAIYAVLKEHGVVIIEDDPYGALAYESYNKTFTNGNTKSLETPEKAHDESVDSEARESDISKADIDHYTSLIAPSYLTIDDAGLVVRIDTFSKVFSPGLRLGWIVSHVNFIEKLSLYTSLSTRAASGVSQLLINNIAHSWGLEGWLRWCLLLRNQYLERRNHLLAQLDKLDQSKITYITPVCGMFVSALVHFDKIAPSSFDGVTLPYQSRLVELGIEEGVLIVSGSNMAASDELRQTAKFIRLTFAYEDPDLLDEAIKRLGKAVDRLFEEGEIKKQE
ncbi:Aromatic amino acid aminotransferase [Yarrowia sp. B02]|nr:Aromatic amino acid aminotransferase [Yarrowia sp. B02]